MTAYAMITEYDTAQYVKVIRNIAGGNMKDKIIKNTYGFTLIEMIVVMIIIGILAAIMVPSLLHYIDRSKADECEVNRKALVLLLEGARAQEPGKTMYDIVDENEANGEITCPSGGKYEAVNNNTVRCNIPEHGENGVFTDESEHAMGDVEVIVPEIPSTDSEDESEESGDDDTKETGKEGEICFNVDDVWFSATTIEFFAQEYIESKPSNPSKLFNNNTVYADIQGNYYYQFDYSGQIQINGNNYEVQNRDFMVKVNTDNILFFNDIIDYEKQDLNQDILKGQIVYIESKNCYLISITDKYKNDGHGYYDAISINNTNLWRSMTLCSE